MKERLYPPYTARRLYDGLYEIDQEGMVRSFLVLGTREAMLVDSCESTEGNLRGQVEEITQLPLRVVHTHSDYDHIAASAQFENLYMHPSEFSRLRKTAKVPLEVKAVREGDIIDLGERRFEVLLLPGHTSGSIALLDEENRLLISGDSVLLATHYMFGPGRDLPAYVDTLRRLCACAGRFDTILPSHGPLPVPGEYLSELLEGAEKLLAGQLSGEDDGSGMPCLLYTHKRAQFYY